MNKNVFGGLVLAASLAVANVASAAGTPAVTIDVTAVTDTMSSLYSSTGPVTLIGIGMLILTVALKAFKWSRKAL